MQEYSVVDLGAEGLEAAYHLVRASRPDLSLDEWLSRGRALLDSGGGVLALSGPADFLLGILAYRADRVAAHLDRSLAIDLLAAFEFTRAGTGRRVLIEAFERKARAGRPVAADEAGTMAAPADYMYQAGRRGQQGQPMEYGEAITSQAFERAVTIARRLRHDPQIDLATAASRAVAEAYCVCVTDGEDAAEHRFSDVHRKLIEDVVTRVRETEAGRPAPQGREA